MCTKTAVLSLSHSHLEKTTNPIPNLLIIKRLIIKLPSILLRPPSYFENQFIIKLLLISTLTFVCTQLIILFHVFA